MGGKVVAIPEEQLVTLEKKIFGELPYEYKSFIKKYGACKFKTLVVFKPIEDLPGYISSSGHGCFDYFFGASSNENDDIYSLFWAMNAYKNRVPDSLFPIGGDLGGGLVCIGISGKLRNKVYYWNPL